MGLVVLILVGVVGYFSFFVKGESGQKDESGQVELVSNEAPIKPLEYQQMLGVGMDVDFAKTKKGKNFYNEKILQDFKEKGISHIRIRVMDDMSSELLSDIQKVVDGALANDITPIIAYQANSFKENPNQENLQRAVSWWRQTAEHFQNYSYKLSFDNMIEATDALNDKPEWQNKYQEEVTKEIRKTNPQRIVFISPIVRSEPEQLHLLKIPSMHNNFLMTEFHFYASGPSKTNPKKLWTTGTEAEKNIIRNKIKLATDWGRENNIPMWVGAWMPGIYSEKWQGGKDGEYTISEQVVFANFVSCELKKNNIPHAFNSDQHFYDRENLKWRDEMLPVLNTILEPRC